ncbi:MAG TPA: YIP1 family protein [Sporosarcina psychrophila]|uniref:YIP1 family protein n=1 Tax=Sporosarcina psychrophila TaxID=1476 RepID=A0A921G305_SPOPS|nr:YIP1 family protein [Sporosarcina psychrophila]
MNCVKCGHSQEVGKFCGKCGTPFASINNETATSEQAATTVNMPEEGHLPPAQKIEQMHSEKRVEPNIHMEKIKAQSKMYGSYFMQHLKRPSHAFNQSQEGFVNGLISIILLGIVFALTVSAVSSSFLSSYGPGFISVFGSTIISVLIVMGIPLLALFIINKFFGQQQSFKSIISIYGAHLSPVIIGAGAAFLLILMKSFAFGNFILATLFVFAIFILPLYLISALLTRKSTNALDPLYGFILYLVSFAILFILFITILADSALGQFIDMFSMW